MGPHMKLAGNARHGRARKEVCKWVRGRPWEALYTWPVFGRKVKFAATGLNMQRVVASAAGP